MTKQINILGYGLMGRQIAACLYLGGYTVNIWNHRDVNKSDIDLQIKLLNRTLKSDITGEIKFYTLINELPDTLTIESVIENLAIKKSLYTSLKDNKSPYFTNSSSFSPSEINERVNGFHFFNPINIGLIELHLPTDNQPISKQITTLTTYFEKINFNIIKVNDNRGYIGNYILFNEISSALKLIEKYDYTCEQINDIYLKLYNGRNIFKIIDLVGIDVVNNILKNLNEVDEAIYLPKCLTLAIEQNILGRKNKTSIKTILG